ncbi:phosphonate C-P lyase system protein PhnG [Brucella sp. C7-11G]
MSEESLTGVRISGRREEWMAVLARAPLDLLRTVFDSYRHSYEAQRLTGPQIGLIQLRAKVPVSGTPFHLGEATVTRCVVGACGRRGYSVILGRNQEQAELAAFFDALLQDPLLYRVLKQELLRPAEEVIDARRRRKARDAQATAAYFFTAARAGGAG